MFMLSTLMVAAKQNPLKMTLGSAASLIAVVAALFTVDARYAHAADVEKANSQLQQSIEQSAMGIRRQMLEDRIFEIDIKKAQSSKQQLNPIDQAVRDRYQQQLNDINSKKQQN